MRLNTAQLVKVEEQIGIKAVSEEHPSISKFKEVFGDHTFFLNDQGLSVVEPNPSLEGSSGNVVKLASWAEDRTKLRSHEPQVLLATVDLGSGGSDPAA